MSIVGSLEGITMCRVFDVTVIVRVDAESEEDAREIVHLALDSELNNPIDDLESPIQAWKVESAEEVKI